MIVGLLVFFVVNLVLSKFIEKAGNISQLFSPPSCSISHKLLFEV